jgi:hypothetical protein
LVALGGALGLGLIAVADAAGRRSLWWAEPLFWCGLLLIFLPAVLRVACRSAMAGERLGLTVLVGVDLYLVKLLHSPLGFTFVDEFMHWRTADDILRTGHLFAPNTLLPVSPLYPGLEIVTSALAGLGGMTIFTSGVLVIAAGRLILMLSLYLLYQQAGGSSRVAALGTLLYMTNPNFLYFDAQFAYESLALPFAVLTLFAIACRDRLPRGQRVGATLLVCMCIIMVVITHHLTSYALTAFLAIWVVSGLCFVRGRPRTDVPIWPLLLTAVLASAWLLEVGTLAIGYLAPHVQEAVQQILRLIAGEAPPRQLFHTTTGRTAPLWERLVGYGSIVFVLLGLPAGLYRIWGRYRNHALALSMGLAALAYPLSLGLRLISAGAEISNRSSEFLFVPVAFVLAAAVVELGRRPRWGRLLRPVLPLWAAVLLVGGVVIGWPPWDRLPGSYLIGADSRSIEPRGLQAAAWARTNLGPQHRVAADFTNVLLMGSYGEQHALTHLSDGIDVSTLFLPTTFGAAQLAVVQHGKVQYVVVDQRLSTGVSQGSSLFELATPGTRPLDPKALAKFDHLGLVSRIYDNGSIIIYDVRGLSHAP